MSSNIATIEIVLILIAILLLGNVISQKENEEDQRSGLQCYDCIDCDEPFPHEFRDCYSAKKCYIVNVRLEFGQHKVVKINKTYRIDTRRKMTIRGCSDYGLSCDVLETNKDLYEEKQQRHVFAAMGYLDCKECDGKLCNNDKTENLPRVNRTIAMGVVKEAALTTAVATVMAVNWLVVCAVYAIVIIVNKVG